MIQQEKCKKDIKMTRALFNEYADDVSRRRILLEKLRKKYNAEARKRVTGLCLMRAVRRVVFGK